MKTHQISFLPFVAALVAAALSACSTPKPRASASAAELAPQPSSHARPAFHTVAPGDTGISIARRYGMKFRELADYNPQTDWSQLGVGARIQLSDQAPADEDLGVRASERKANPFLIEPEAPTAPMPEVNPYPKAIVPEKA